MGWERGEINSNSISIKIFFKKYIWGKENVFYLKFFNLCNILMSKQIGTQETNWARYIKLVIISIFVAMKPQGELTSLRQRRSSDAQSEGARKLCKEHGDRNNGTWKRCGSAKSIYLAIKGIWAFRKCELPMISYFIGYVFYNTRYKSNVGWRKGPYIIQYCYV